MSNLSGQRIGPYQLISLLGEGGMASVYRAYQPALQLDVAVKILNPTWTADEDLIRRFAREAKTGARLNHPHIVKVLDFGKHDDMLYLAMDLVTGGTLYTLIHQGQLSIQRFIQLLEQVADALDYAHDQAVIHRDIKPLNILLDDQGNAHLADFGIARILTETTIAGPIPTIAGTRAYMAPEQWYLGYIDAQTDVYAFGVTAFEMLTGTLPFTGLALSEAIMGRGPLLPLSLRQLRPDLPRALEYVLFRAMAKEREDRFLTAGEFVEAVKEAIDRGDSVSNTKVMIASPDPEDGVDTRILTASPLAPHDMTLTRVTVQQAEAVARLERELALLTSRLIPTRAVGLLPQDVHDRYRGRKRLRSEIAALIGGSARLISIYGRGGVGKTALACKVLSDLEAADDAARPDGMVYLSASTRDQIDNGINLDRIFGEFSRLLPNETRAGIESSRVDPLLPTRQKISSLLAVLQGRRYVLLLDNLDSLQDPESGEITDPELRLFFEVALEQASALCIMITSREPLTLPRQLKTWEHIVSLDAGLPLPDALALLRSFDPSGKAGLNRAPVAKLRVFVEKTGGSPRALEAIAGLLLNDAIYTIDDLLADERLLAQEVAAVTVEEALSRFTPSALRVMQALALFGRPVNQVALEFLLAPYIQIEKLHSLLNRLVLSHFVNHDSRVRTFALHPIDQEYCYARIPAGTPADKPQADMLPAYSRIALHFRAADYYARQRKAEADWKSIDDLTPQLAEFDHLIQAEDYDAAAMLLFTFDLRYLRTWGHYSRLISMYQRLRGQVTTTLLERSLTNNLGMLYGLLGYQGKALACYEQALDSARRDNHRRHEALALNNVANCQLFFFGNIDLAIINYEVCLHINLNNQNINGVSAALGNLGSAYFALGQIERAIEYYNQCLELARETGDSEREIFQLVNLGEIQTSLGDSRTAIKILQLALTRARQVSDMRALRYATAYLLEAFIAADKLPEAFQLIEEVQDPVSSDIKYRVDALKGLCLLRLEKASQAAQAFDDARISSDELLGRTSNLYPVLYARGLARAGLALIGLDTIANAAEDYTQAKIVCSANGIMAANLRLIDALSRCDPTEILGPLRDLLTT